jgi:hypothetical protein
MIIMRIDLIFCTFYLWFWSIIWTTINQIKSVMGPIAKCVLSHDWLLCANGFFVDISSFCCSIK